MGYVKAGWGRIALVTAAAVGVTIGFCGDAVAKHGRHIHHRRRLVRHVHKIQSSCGCNESAQLAWPQSAPLGPMRYYGGPKSPMWRAPAEN
jgi:hypothetical protein